MATIRELVESRLADAEAKLASQEQTKQADLRLAESAESAEPAAEEEAKVASVDPNELRALAAGLSSLDAPVESETEKQATSQALAAAILDAEQEKEANLASRLRAAGRAFTGRDAEVRDALEQGRALGRKETSMPIPAAPAASADEAAEAGGFSRERIGKALLGGAALGGTAVGGVAYGQRRGQAIEQAKDPHQIRAAYTAGARRGIRQGYAYGAQASQYKGASVNEAMLSRVQERVFGTEKQAASPVGGTMVKQFQKIFDDAFSARAHSLDALPMSADELAEVGSQASAGVLKRTIQHAADGPYLGLNDVAREAIGGDKRFSKTRTLNRLLDSYKKEQNAGKKSQIAAVVTTAADFS